MNMCIEVLVYMYLAFISCTLVPTGLIILTSALVAKIFQMLPMMLGREWHSGMLFTDP